MFFWAIAIILVAAAPAASWYFDRKRRLIRSGGDGFGNSSEQRFLEEEHGVTSHGGLGGSVAPATTRQGESSSIGYYSNATTGVNKGIAGHF